MLTDKIVDAVKVQFIKQIFEDDFPEKGMVAWLTDVEYDSKKGCYKLYFDFTEFESQNDKYLKQTYFRNIHTDKISTSRSLFTGKEAGVYSNKYSVHFSIHGNVANTKTFEIDIGKYLNEV